MRPGGVSGRAGEGIGALRGSAGRLEQSAAVLGAEDSLLEFPPVRLQTGLCVEDLPAGARVRVRSLFLPRAEVEHFPVIAGLLQHIVVRA